MILNLSFKFALTPFKRRIPLIASRLTNVILRAFIGNSTTIIPGEVSPLEFEFAFSARSLLFFLRELILMQNNFLLNIPEVFLRSHTANLRIFIDIDAFDLRYQLESSTDLDLIFRFLCNGFKFYAYI
jgi:hypothetical protein